ncbi:MAG: hypothetical protein ABJB11_13910 [Ferruginibacter sp.]
MKFLFTRMLVIVLFALFASCKSSPAHLKILSNKDTRNDIIQTIAKDSMMSNEMIEAMMNSENGLRAMQQHQIMLANSHKSILNMLKTKPGLMQGMLLAMMESASQDSSMMSAMINIMKANLQMMQLMQSGTDNSSVNGMPPMTGMGH